MPRPGFCKHSFLLPAFSFFFEPTKHRFLYFMCPFFYWFHKTLNYFVSPLLIEFLSLNRFWIRQISYKIIFGLQPNIKQILNIYFLTTIRFFADFPPFVYTLYRQEKNHERTYPPSIFRTKPCNSKTTNSALISEIVFLTSSANTDSDTGIVPNISIRQFSASSFFEFFF